MRDNARMQVNCLVQLNNNNRLDFEEWLDYHIGLGFDTIYVFDYNSREWLNDVCERRKAHVVHVPDSEKWSHKSDIIRTYVSRREVEEWCVCLDDEEFIWVDARRGNIQRVCESIPGNVAAMTVYHKLLSSKKPMKYRVGTQIDCFTHSRRAPEGFVPEYPEFPNSGVTFFRVVNRDMPLRDSVMPVYANAWCDTEYRRMTPDRYVRETTDKRPGLNVNAYSVRCYRYGIRSGAEMDFNNAYAPVGFDIQDLAMQEARARYMHVPMNDKTEELFAKDTDPNPPTAKVETAEGKEVEISAEAAAEAAFPVTRARIDKLIFKGMFLEDIAKYVATKNPNFDYPTLERMFEEERQNIIKTSPVYADLQELVDRGMSDGDIMKTLVLTKTTYEHMRTALPVLDIKTEYAAQVEAAEAAEGVSLGVQIGPAPVVEEVTTGDAETEDLVGNFDEQVEQAAPSAEELAAREEAVRIMDEKNTYKGKKAAKERNKAKASTKKAKKIAPKVVAAAAVADETPAAQPTVPEVKESADENADSLGLDALDDDLTDDINIDAVISSVSTKEK